MTGSFASRRPGVNEPCPCGSGKKYKKCHGARTRAGVTPGWVVPVRTLLADAKLALATDRLPEAQDGFLAVLAHEANSYDALAGMSELAERAGDEDAARHYYARFTQAHPNDVTAHFAAGNFFTRRYEFDHARTCYRRAVALNPDVSGVWNNLGNVEKYLGNLGEAIACYDRSVACDPDNASLHSNSLISLYYDASISHDELYARHVAWAERHAARFYPKGRTWANSRDPSRRLRIGYVSGSLDGRVLGHFLWNVIANHDHDTVELYAYSGTRHADDMTEDLAQLFDFWYDTRALDDDAIAAQIERNAIDILIDLDGHTPDARLLVFARKPAPIQITWLGYWNTTGMTTIDYILTDPYTTPEEGPQRFTEEVLRLPDSRICYAPVSYAPEVASLPCNARNAFTFGSFNRYDKIGSELVGCWAEILQNVPNSRVIIKNSAIALPHAREALLRQFAAHGIVKERIDLRARSPHKEMLVEYGEIDLGLDTFPYNGGLTTCEALWMGVPMVAIEEERMISRQTAAMLRQVGGEDFIGQTQREYVSLAIRWSEQRETLAAVRATLRDRMRMSPLCDGERFGRNLDAALRTVWRRYCASADG